MKRKTLPKNQPMSDKQISEMLIGIFERFQANFDRFQWANEILRWHELVFCLLSTIENRFGPDTKSASAMRALVELNLLDTCLLAKKEEKTREHLTVVLERTGFTLQQAGQAADALFELALCLEEKYQGKVQLLLRALSREMEVKVLQALPLDGVLGGQKASLAIGHWLQNVLNLPIYVPSPGFTAFLKKTGASSEQVLAIVDEHNINLALVDEILNAWSNTGLPAGTD